MKLFLMCMNYAPERTGIALFTTDLAEYLAQRGHRVTVATTFPHYPEWETQEAYRGKWTMRETRNGVTVLRRRIYLPKRASALRRILYDTSLAVTAFWSGLRTRDVDLILAVEPPIQAGAVARVLARWKRVPYVLWIQDLALEAAMSVGMMHASPALRFGQQLENWSHARARKLILISDGFRKNLSDKGHAAEKFVVLPNWADVDALRPAEHGGDFRKRYGIADDALLVLHSGNMGVKQALENVLRAASVLRAPPRVVFALVGDGSQKNVLMQMAQRENLENVFFIPLQARADLPYMLAAADVLLLNQHADLVEAVIPSKLLTYMAAARPIVIAAHAASEAARQVHAAGCGVLVAPDNPAALANAILELGAAPDARARLGARGREYVETHFARAILLREFETVLTECVH